VDLDRVTVVVLPPATTPTLRLSSAAKRHPASSPASKMIEVRTARKPLFRFRNNAQFAASISELGLMSKYGSATSTNQ
jgi:hypothetical protein